VPLSGFVSLGTGWPPRLDGNVDIPFEVRQIIELARYVDAEAARWLEGAAM